MWPTDQPTNQPPDWPTGKGGCRVGCTPLKIVFFLFFFSIFQRHFMLRIHLFSRVHATLQPALSVGWSVGWLIGQSVTLYFFYDFISLTSLLLPKWPGDLKYGPCPPARDLGSRVSGLVSFQCREKQDLVFFLFFWGFLWLLRLLKISSSFVKFVMRVEDRKKRKTIQFHQ